MAYSQNVLDHYENPRNVGSFDKSDTDVEPEWWGHRLAVM
jgi:hypothetical protein